MLSRRCTQRQYLLTPNDEINNAFLYCVIEAAEIFDIVLLLPQMMSNHHHTDFYDPKGNAIEFTHRAHTNFAKCVNAIRGRSEAVWSNKPPCLVELISVDDVVNKLIYTATNPVTAGLVDEVHKWPGPKTVQAFLSGRTLKARRPRPFRKDGPMKEEVQVRLVFPSEVGNHAEIVERVRAGIADEEQRRADARDRPVIGRRRIRRQSWHESPTSREPRRGIRPRVAARCKWSRIEALQRNKEFQIAYKEARTQWLADMPAVFPAGTYWLRKFANVQVESIDPPPPMMASSN